MYIFIIPRTLTSHEYYQTPIIAEQVIYTSSQISCNHNIHQISPMHIFTKLHIQVWHISPTSSACNVVDTSTCMWYQLNSGDNLTI